MSNEKKAQQLGMPIGTASHKLRKTIMFALIVETQRNVCFQCGLRILTEDTLSIEHKVPWLDNDPALFWDLDNIGFSHLSCNIAAATRENRKLPKTAFKPRETPEGKLWCNNCKQFKSEEDFNQNHSRGHSYRNREYRCKVCRSGTRKK